MRRRARRTMGRGRTPHGAASHGRGSRRTSAGCKPESPVPRRKAAGRMRGRLRGRSSRRSTPSSLRCGRSPRTGAGTRPGSTGWYGGPKSPRWRLRWHSAPRGTGPSRCGASAYPRRASKARPGLSGYRRCMTGRCRRSMLLRSTPWPRPRPTARRSGSEGDEAHRTPARGCSRCLRERRVRNTSSRGT